MLRHAAGGVCAVTHLQNHPRNQKSRRVSEPGGLDRRIRGLPEAAPARLSTQKKASDRKSDAVLNFFLLFITCAEPSELEAHAEGEARSLI